MSEDKFDFLRFRREVETGGSQTFGVDEPVYENLLQESGFADYLKQAKTPTVVLLGCAIRESMQEFVRFIDNYNKNSKIVIADISDYALLDLQIGLSELPRASRKRISFLQTDGTEMGLADDSIDAVFTHRLIHNLPGNKSNRIRWTKESQPTSTLLQEIYRVLRPAGGAFLAELGDIRGNKERDEELAKAISIANDTLGRAGFGRVNSSIMEGVSRDQYLEKYNLKNTYVPSGELDPFLGRRDYWIGHERPGEVVGAYAIK